MKHTCAGPLNKAWQGIGIVIKLDEASEEVCVIHSCIPLAITPTAIPQSQDLARMLLL